jgi:methyltransferase family protein
MNRTQLINLLLRQRKGRRYLEIGFKDKEIHFNHVACEYKVSVGSRPGATFACEPDDFFDRNTELFDLIFVDGYHTEGQALKDIRNALRFLNPGGLIVIHDCMPPDNWHQRGPEAYVEGEAWNGTVWKAVLRIFNTLRYKCSLIDMDWGCAVIDTSQSQNPFLRKLPEQLNYELHYPLLLDYKVQVAQFLRGLVEVFFHVACMHNWKFVFEEEIQHLHRNGFDHVNLTLLGSDDDRKWVDAVSRELNMDVSVIFQEQELTNFEKPAMLAIEDFARKYDGFVLYLHSKGVSNPDDVTKAKWRRLMLRELIDNWESCMLQLPNYDAIGVNWREMPPVSHFCGNFWYASTQYLRTLADFRHYYENPRYQVWDHISSKRLGCEFWIGSCPQVRPKVLSLVCSNVDFGSAEFWRNKN